MDNEMGAGGEEQAAAELRREAMERLDGLAAGAPALAPLDVAHELSVHQIELEMQNDELRRAQLDLEEQRAKYFELFDLAPVGYLTLSDKGIVGDANLTAARLLGVDLGLLVGQPFSAFVLAADRAEYYLRQGALQQSGELLSYELRLQRHGAANRSSDAGHFWARLSARWQEDPGSPGGRCRLAFNDSSEHMAVLEALRAGEEQLACAVDGSGVGLWDWYPQTGEETFSERWAEIAGYTLAELEPTSIETWRRLTHPDDLVRAEELLKEHFAGRSPIYAFEERVLHKDGHWVWVLDRGSVSEWDEEGRPVRMTGVAIDISERKRMEEALRLRESYLTAIIENQPGLVWLKDADSRFLAVNQAFADTCGQGTPEAVAGKTDFDVWPADLAESYRHDDARTIQGGTPIMVEEPIDGQGERRWFETFKTPVAADDGSIIGTTGYARDITERKLAEDKLRETTTVLSGLLSSIPDIVFFKDPDGVYMGCNPQFARFVGRDVAEIVGATDHHLFDPQIADFFREQDHAMMASGEPRHNEEWVVYPDGTRVLLDTHKAPLSDASGTVLGMLGVSHDITKRRSMEEGLRQSERRLRDIVDTIADWVWEVDENGVYTFSSRSGGDLLGGSRGEIVGKTPFDFMPPEEAERVAPLFAELLARKAPIVDLENWNIGAGGERICLLSNGVPILDEAGELRGYRGVDKDITARKRAEEELRRLSERLSVATHVGGVGVWDRDLEVGTTTWDEEMFALYGLETGQVGDIQEAWRAGVHPGDRERVDAELEAALRGEKDLDTDSRVVWPDGSTHVIRTLADVQRDASGQPVRLIGTSRDITEHRRVETELRRLREEEVRRQREEAVVAAVADERSRLARELHDSVTQALFAATLKCEVLQQSAGSATPQMAQTVAELHRLTRGALAEMRALLLELRPDALDGVPLDELLRQLVAACEGRALVSVSLHACGGLQLAPDVKLALYRVAQEALNNVVHHAVATRAWVDLRRSGAAVHLVVGDDGCGFDAARVAPGHLGLSIMRERAAAIGALVNVETGPGRGTLVTLEWPGGQE